MFWQYILYTELLCNSGKQESTNSQLELVRPGFDGFDASISLSLHYTPRETIGRKALDITMSLLSDRQREDLCVHN